MFVGFAASALVGTNSCGGLRIAERNDSADVTWSRGIAFAALAAFARLLSKSRFQLVLLSIRFSISASAGIAPILFYVDYFKRREKVNHPEAEPYAGTDFPGCLDQHQSGFIGLSRIHNR
jgi:hypothetical protein